MLFPLDLHFTMPICYVPKVIAPSDTNERLNITAPLLYVLCLWISENVHMFGNKGILQGLPEQSDSTFMAIMENHHMYLSSADDLRFTILFNCDTT